MTKQNGYFIWNKTDKPEWLSNYFKSDEFSCKCSHDDCMEQKISEDLINRLTWLREASQSPLRIHSAFRCAKKQEDIRNSGTSTVVAKKSTHQTGDAADVSSSKLVPGELLKLAEHVFVSIGTASNFLHLDTRPLKSDGSVRRWKY